MTTARPAAELDSDLVVRDLSAVSAQVGADGPTTGTEGRAGPSLSGMRSVSVRYPDTVDR
ncbi:hypothetical protein ACGFYQ_14600 [Streptomyces sp. NPDC048258]|uniref:hypothetical protein n=1 Tax=Streptomyces sp. NPDC048258 TaxID=3365527 RepID=UPI00371F7162